MKDFEQIGSELESGEERVKTLRNPLSLYFHVLKRERGVEILWCQGKNKGKDWVHPGRFPFETLSLDPDGPIMRTRHHSLFAAVPWYFSNVILKMKAKLGSAFVSRIRDKGEVEFDGRRCRKVVLVNPDFGYSRCRVNTTEKPDTLAGRHFFSLPPRMQP